MPVGEPLLALSWESVEEVHVVSTLEPRGRQSRVGLLYRTDQPGSTTEVVCGHPCMWSGRVGADRCFDGGEDRCERNPGAGSGGLRVPGVDRVVATKVGFGT